MRRSYGMKRRTFLQALLSLPALAGVRLPEQEEEPPEIIYTDSEGRTPTELAPLADGTANIEYQA